MNPPEREADGSGARSSPQIRAWRVLHACGGEKQVITVALAQSEAGMRPAVVTLSGLVSLEFAAGTTECDQRLSLLNAWSDVRQWRRALLDADPALDSEIVHAHSFAAGMSAVRNCPCVVYALEHFIEDLQPDEKTTAAESTTWIARSFRVAEQFVLARAAAVVVPRNSLRQAAIQRGAPPDSVFVVPKLEELLVTPGTLVARYDRVYRHAFARRRSGNLQTPAAQLQPQRA